ncbi:MAG: hypothetical protein ACK4NN_09245, partial [Rheinheimera sp.]
FDIVFFELLFAVFWFNPFLLFYGKSIRLNHEFLAEQYAKLRFESSVKRIGKKTVTHFLKKAQSISASSLLNHSLNT